MSVPAKRRSRSEARRGRSHQALKKKTLHKCPQCGKAKRPHCACVFCGYYRGREAVKIKAEKKKKEKK